MKMPTLEQIRTNRNVLFWSLHAAGWAAYGITQYFGALLYEKPSSYARVIAVAAVSGFLLSMPMRFIYRRLWGRPPRLMITGVLATCYITALALRIVINLSYKQFVEPDWHAQTLFELFGGALSTTYLLLCWSVLYFGIKSYESQRKQEQAMLKAVALAQEAQLKMLRYQLNPHFLFNTLNAISTLILDNQNRKANHAVTRLSEFLRYTLDQDPMKKVTLRLDFLAQRDLLHRVLIEGVAQERRQARHRLVCLAVLVVEDERRDGIECVEQEVRVELVAQHFQLRLLRQRHRLEHRLFLLALRLVGLDAEVQHAPAQQQVGRGERAAEQLEQRLRVPIRLDELLVGQVDHDAQRERGDVAGREHAGDHEARRPAPQAPVDEAHRHRQQEPRDRRHRDHPRVAGGLLVQQRPEVLRDAVGGPAGGVQAPEQHVAVGAELLERRHFHAMKA